MDCCWKQYWWWVFWSQFPRLPPEATADVFCHGGGGGQKLESQPNHPTQLQSLDSNYPSLWYNLSSPGLYSPDPMPGSLFPRHLHFSCLPAWLVACLFYISPFVPSIPHLCHFNSQPSDTKTFISLILQFPIIMYTDFSTVAHSFTIPYFDQFKKYNRHISWSSWFKMVVSYAINTKEKDSSQRQLWLWLLPNSKKRKSLHFLC